VSTDKLGGRKTLAVEGILEEFEKDGIKARVDIVSLFGSFGVNLTAKGKSFVGNCPWHEDKDPSLSVDRDKGLYHCFGCGESGDVVALVEKMKGVGFRAAMEYLKANAGSAPSNGKKAKATAQKTEPAQALAADKAPPAPDASAQTQVAAAVEASVSLDAVADFYHRRLLETPSACAYLEKRGLTDKRLWVRFKVGFADGNLAATLSQAQRGKLESMGLFSEGGRETFAGYLTVPLLDENGAAVGLYGRAVDSSLSPAHRYLAGPHRGLLNPKAFTVYREEMILTESVIDALSLLQLGLQNVSACYGTGGFTSVHRKALADAAVRSVVVAFDSDEAGAKGADKLAGKLLADGISVKLVSPPSGKDWNDHLVSGGALDAVKDLLSRAELKHPIFVDRLTVSREGGKLTVSSGGILYRLTGQGDPYVGTLRTTIRAERGGERHVDHVDLYSARSRTGFAVSLSALWAVETKRIEADLMRILDVIEQERERSLWEAEGAKVELSEEDRALGLELLRDPDLFERIEGDMDLLGYVGEGINKKLLYLAASSRLLDDPLSVLVVSESSAGKSALIETVRRMMPDEAVVAMSSLSDQALHYLGEDGLLHKFLVMGEALHAPVVEQQIREMLSAHELCRLVTLKDPKTGEMESRTVRKSVIVAAALSSTDYTINPENVSRFFVVNADESEAQTQRIHRMQRRKYSVERICERETKVPRILAAHHAAQRLLERRRIVNPFAELLSFPTRQMRARRDHERFLDLIAAVCHLRQFQKSVKQMSLEGSTGGVEYIACDSIDYRIAHTIMRAVLPATLGAFPRGAESLYEAVRELARVKAREEGLRADEVSLSQREVRESCALGQRWVKRYMRLLADYEYLQVVGGRGRGSRYSYRLVRDEPLRGVDLSPIPSPEEVEARLRNPQSGPTGP
jgi:DNA primase catalytic core